MLLLPENIEASFRQIKKYLAEGKLNWKDLNQRIKKVLHAKYQYNLHQLQPIKVENIKVC